MKIHEMIERRQAGPSPQPKRPAGVMHCLYKSTALILITATLIACGDSERRPSPVERKDGMAYIPIDKTAFLIPENTWLKSYGIKKIDGLVDDIVLHATVPDVQPWSPERHEEMYWPLGPGNKIVIYIWGDQSRQARAFPTPHRTLFPGEQCVEEPSDEEAQGLRRFRRLSIFDPSPAELEKYRAKFGDEFTNKLLAKHGKPEKDYVFYELIESNRVKYAIKCDDENGTIFRGCNLFFPWNDTLMIEARFPRNKIQHAVKMADSLSATLRKFEQDGLAYKAAH